MSVAIHRSNVRAGLEPRREPYWGPPLEPGRFIGFRKIDAQRGSWVARVRTEPQFGLGVRGRYGPSGEFGQCGTRSPRVCPQRSA